MREDDDLKRATELSLQGQKQDWWNVLLVAYGPPKIGILSILDNAFSSEIMIG